jgi:hypothetical protein
VTDSGRIDDGRPPGHPGWADRLAVDLATALVFSRNDDSQIEMALRRAGFDREAHEALFAGLLAVRADYDRLVDGLPGRVRAMIDGLGIDVRPAPPDPIRGVSPTANRIELEALRRDVDGLRARVMELEGRPGG